MRVLERFERVAKLHHLWPRTIECCREWIVQFLGFCRDGQRWRHPVDVGGAEFGAFLTNLAADRQLSASSQSQAACAVVFLYKQVLVDEVGPEHLGRFAGRRRIARDDDDLHARDEQAVRRRDESVGPAGDRVTGDASAA